jgi:small multidrug resistance pump
VSTPPIHGCLGNTGLLHCRGSQRDLATHKIRRIARPVYGLLALVILGACFWALSQVLTRIPMGVAYAIWSGTGIALICVVGWLFFRQPLTTMQVLCIGLVVVGAIGLSLSTNPA